MQTHQISASTLASQYHGSGLALAASSTHAAFFARQWLKTADGQLHAVRLAALGEPVLGMCSAIEFVRL